MAPQCPRCGHPVARSAPAARKSSTIAGICALIVIIATAWFMYSVLFSPNQRDTVNRVATGVGVPIVPWTSRARTVADDLFRAQGGTVATNIRAITHPTGNGGTLTSYNVTIDGEEVVSRVTVSWNGGFLGTSYVTTVEWRCSQSGSSSARVVADSAIIGVAAENAAQLDSYFATTMYPRVR